MKKAERNLAAQSSKFNYTSHCSTTMFYTLPHFLGKVRFFFYDLDAGSLFSRKFLPDVLMEVPLFEMLIQFNKVKTHNMQQPILDKSFALVAQLLLFLPSRPKKQNMKASKSITKLSKNLGLLKSGELHSMYTRFFGYESFFFKVLILRSLQQN